MEQAKLGHSYRGKLTIEDFSRYVAQRIIHILHHCRHVKRNGIGAFQKDKMTSEQHRELMEATFLGAGLGSGLFLIRV